MVGTRSLPRPEVVALAAVVLATVVLAGWPRPLQDLTGANRAIADQLRERGAKLALGPALHDPDDPMGKMFFNILATFAEFAADLIRPGPPAWRAPDRQRGPATVPGGNPAAASGRLRLHIRGFLRG